MLFLAGTNGFRYVQIGSVLSLHNRAVYGIIATVIYKIFPRHVTIYVSNDKRQSEFRNGDKYEVFNSFGSWFCSHFQDEKMKQSLKVKLEMAKFLQKTLDNMTLQGTGHSSVAAKEFAEFCEKVSREFS